MGLFEETGVHGVRYWEGRLQSQRDGVWRDKPRHKVYGVRIDPGNPHPEGAVVYTDDAVGMAPGSEAWDREAVFRGIRPCLLQEGAVRYYLDPRDFSLRQDGAPADIASGGDGDVMIEVPRMAYAMYQEGGYQYIKVTASPHAKRLDPRFCYYGHSRQEEGDRDKLYIGAYLGSLGDGKLRSLSGKEALGGGTLGEYRAMAQSQGTGYGVLSFFPLTLLQCLLLLRTKSLDSKTALGRGYVDKNPGPAPTGGTDAKGMYFGEATGRQQVKFAGIEDFWGNLYQRLDGVATSPDYRILTAFGCFNDGGEGYRDEGSWGPSTVNTWLTRIQCTNGRGFLGAVSEHSSQGADFWRCYTRLAPGSAALFGGYYSDGDLAGGYYYYLQLSPDYAHAMIGGRLMYL